MNLNSSDAQEVDQPHELPQTCGSRPQALQMGAPVGSKGHIKRQKVMCPHFWVMGFILWQIAYSWHCVNHKRQQCRMEPNAVFTLTPELREDFRSEVWTVQATVAKPGPPLL